MPSSVARLLESVGLTSAGNVPWGLPVPEKSTGVYLVSLSDTASSARGTGADCPLSVTALDHLLSICPDLAVDGVGATREALAARISSYWLNDEPVLYIGLTSTPLRKRVSAYYRTRLGDAKPHKGGWWLKTLANLSDLHVHYAPTPDFKRAEEDMLRAFAEGLSKQSRAAWPDAEPVMPFANLRDWQWVTRRHGVSGEVTAPTAGTNKARAAAAPKKPRRAGASSAPRPPAASRAGSRPSASTTTPHHRTQEVSAADIAAGQVRIPIVGGTRRILPIERSDIDVSLRGRELVCRWDPRYVPRERSGVIRVGTAAARELLRPGEVLAVVMRNGVVELT